MRRLFMISAFTALVYALWAGLWAFIGWGFEPSTWLGATRAIFILLPLPVVVPVAIAVLEEE